MSGQAMTKEDHIEFFKYYLSQFNGSKTDASRAAWALLIANELSKIIDSLADIEPMLALHSVDVTELCHREGK